MFDHISKHLEVRQKYSATRHIFNSLLGLWKCGQTQSFVLDILGNPLDPTTVQEKERLKNVPPYNENPFCSQLKNTSVS